MWSISVGREREKEEVKLCGTEEASSIRKLHGEFFRQKLFDDFINFSPFPRRGRIFFIKFISVEISLQLFSSFFLSFAWQDVRGAETIFEESHAFVDGKKELKGFGFEV
jgi:hypothetical protein